MRTSWRCWKTTTSPISSAQWARLKPGLFRRSTLVFILWVIDYTAKHIYGRGRLARVSTIHFARWVFLDNKKRLSVCQQL